MNKELTPTSIFLGIIIGIIMTMANVYLGLYAGMTVSASIPAAVVSLAIFSLLGKKSLLESNIVQTMASAGESLAAGIIFTLPALVLVGAWSDFDYASTTIIAITGGLLGVLFMIPLRKTLIEEDEDLIYPEGVACAAVLRTAGGDKASDGLSVIFKGLFVGGVFKLLSNGFKLFVGSFEKAFRLKGSTFFFGLDISPALLAVGYIVNLNVAALVFLGGAIGWLIGIPMIGTPAEFAEIEAPLDLAWTLWSKRIRYLGVGAMIVGGVWSIISVRKGVMSGLGSLKLKGDANQGRESQDLGMTTISIVFTLSFLSMFAFYYQIINSLGVTILTSVLMLVTSFIFVAVSSYIVGLVGSSNNPVSGMTISALLLTAALFLALGFTGDSAILATLGVAAIVCCAACTAGDCSQDLKTGSILKASPRSQQIAQMIGVIIPAFFIAPTLSLLHEAYGIGEGLKAPQATLFASITQALFGKGELPYNMVAWGAIIGIIILFLDNFFLKGKKFRLHLMPIAVGIYLPITLAVPMLIGGIIRFLVEKKKGSVSDSDSGTLLASGLIAGEALMGVAIAVVLVSGGDLSALFSGVGEHVKEIASLLALSALTIYFYRLAKR